MFSGNHFLQAMFGVVYAVDDDGMIIDYGRNNWNNFADENNCPELCDKSSFLGKSILDFVSGEDTKASYEGFMEALLSGRRDWISFPFSCDAPEVHRDMLMAITPLTRDDVRNGVLFQSIVLESTHRAPVSLFNFKSHASASRDNINHPFMGMCSYCQNVRFPAGSNEENGVWIHPNEYYQRGGTQDVQISHGICPNCYESKVRPQIDE